MKLTSILKSFHKTSAQLEQFISQCDKAMDKNDEAIEKCNQSNMLLEDEVAVASRALNAIGKITGVVTPAGVAG